ncbi:hypothetical protein NP493_458g03052 [Ridgeia piscesae]|uniref:Folliculin n=1 Tax=Ridgeia piscesae TaxID=27915 RepID=A0AAD9NUR0_RIDPI|nr:hypothetical protein NP493_458g03052 [Ridgeia piscesae]
MNAIIALCHFCDLHGPSILFCTQAFHSSDPQLALSETGEGDKEGGNEWCYVRERQLRSPTPAGGSTGATQSEAAETSTPHVPTVSYCEACRSLLPGQPGFISNDQEAKVSYVSSQQPERPELFSIVRQACLRSLSCEVCPGREGPIFFGDDHRGHVLSYTFFMKDSQARGFQHWYSIIVVMMDKVYLLNSWPFLVKYIRTVIDELQDKANKVYETEQTRCPTRTHRLAMSLNPSTFRMHRGGSRPARSLLELTADRQLFRRLHLQFTWILKAGSNRLTERLLEGPPTEDSVIDLEKQEETEEGFVKLFSKKLLVDGEENEEEEGAPQPEDHEEVAQWEGGGEEGETEDPCKTPLFRNLRHLQRVFGYSQFHILAHHVVIGNQVIVRGTRRHLVRSVIDALKALLPRGCCHVINYSSRYEDTWRCNFLGLHPSTPLPPHVDRYVTVTLEEPATEGAETTSVDGADDLFLGYKFSVAPSCDLPTSAPKVLEKIEAVLKNDHLADPVVDQCLTCLKEEWMNKVKVLFRFTKAGGSRSEEDTRRLLQVVGAQGEDKAVLKFWMTGLSVQYRNHMLSSAISNTVS